MIDSKQAADALSDIDDIVRRVRQSQISDTASRSMILLRGGLLWVGKCSVTYLAPRYADYAWILVYVAGIASHGCGQRVQPRTGRAAPSFTISEYRRIP